MLMNITDHFEFKDMPPSYVFLPIAGIILLFGIIVAIAIIRSKKSKTNTRNKHKNFPDPQTLSTEDLKDTLYLKYHVMSKDEASSYVLELIRRAETAASTKRAILIAILDNKFKVSASTETVLIEMVNSLPKPPRHKTQGA